MEQGKYAQYWNNILKNRMENNKKLNKNQQKTNKTKNPEYKKHIATGGIVQLYFIHHFN